MVSHRVAQGECAGSIAARHGVDWREIWDHPDNAALRERARDPSALLPGDALFVPEPAPRWETRSTGASHRFRLAPATATVRLRFVERDEPVAGASYRFFVTGTEEPVREGKTDGDGRLTEEIGCEATEAVVEFPERRLMYRLRLGHLDPVSEPSGAQARLAQLGYYHGRVTGELDEATELALWGFQLHEGLAPTGALDEATQARLRAAYGM